MSGETFRDAWVRVRPVLTWGALASIQLVALVPVWALFAIDTTDLEDWLTDGVPLLLALATQPFLGALAGARLFAVGTSGTKRSPSWLDRFVVGLSTLLLIPLPAEALRRFLVATMIENPSRAQTESWMWLLVFVPVATICFAAGTIFGQILHRSWLAALAAYLGSLVLGLATLVALRDSQFETGVLVVSGLLAALCAGSAAHLRGERRLYGSRPVAANRGRDHAWCHRVATMLGVTGLGLSQYAAFRRAKAELGATQRELAVVVENSKTTAARLSEFRAENARKEQVLAPLRAILPEMLDVPAFMETFEDFARAESVRVVQADVTTSSYDFYDQAVITLELEGDERRIDELEAKVSGLARIVHWRTVSEEPKRSVSLAIYAAPPPPDVSDRDVCPAPKGAGSTVWFWPYADELADDRRQISELCEELTKLEPIADMVGEYQELLAELEELVALIERLRADHPN